MDIRKILQNIKENIQSDYELDKIRIFISLGIVALISIIVIWFIKGWVTVADITSSLDSNVWHYTLSTISQTLAAILGLLGVFAVLKLTGLIKDIIDYRERAKAVLRGDNQYRRKGHNLSEVADLGEIEKAIANIAKEYKEYGDEDNERGDAAMNGHISMLCANYFPRFNLSRLQFLQDTSDNLGHLIRQRSKVLNLVAVPAIVTLIVIVASLIALSVGEVIGYNQTWLVLIVAITIISLVMIAYYGWQILKLN